MAPVEVQNVGVAGAGTMGAGIAQIACLGGYETRLYDPVPEGLVAGEDRLRAALEKGAMRGRWSADEADAAGRRLHTVGEIGDLAGCELVIEAAPEDIELKRELFAQLAGACGPEAILATNTSSLSVTALAAGVSHPERVVGMHFFNPPALMALVEIVAGMESAPEAIEAATETARRMGRTPIQTADEPGFLANRCVRPFTLEALRMLGERVAKHEQIDRIVRVGGGFRMGPFEMMDLVGLDTGLKVALSFWEQSFGEPRWQPHPIQAKMVAVGRLGRKTGRGYYDYAGGGSHRPEDPEGVQPTVDVLDWKGDDGVDLPPETQATILSRIVCGAINEASFAFQTGVGTAEDIDTAMRLGFNWPRGPLEWAQAIGHDRVVAFLEDLRAEQGDRYRPAPILRSTAFPMSSRAEASRSRWPLHVIPSGGIAKRCRSRGISSRQPIKGNRRPPSARRVGSSPPMGDRKVREPAPPAPRRAVIYCLIPRDLAPKLHEPLRRHFRDEQDIEVVVERRETDRRSGVERRDAEGEPPGAERRAILSATGRRTGDRRARQVAVPEPPPLPRRAQRYADRVVFARRLEPAGLMREDRDTARQVARFQAGDREAFGVLYSRYFDRVFGYLRVFLKNREEAEDATQQVFEQLFAAMPGYEPTEKPFRAWMFTVARNVGISALRRQARLEPMDPQELGERIEDESGSEEQELTALNWITDPDLLVFVERLPQSQRQVLALRYMLDLTARQTAEVLGRSENEVRMLQHRAQKFLRERLTAIGRAPKATRRSKSQTRPRQAIVVRERRFILDP